VSRRAPAGGAATRPPFRVVSGLPFGKGLVATRDIAPGEVVARFDAARVHRAPTWQSVQIGPHRHVDDPACMNLLNHSCAPTVRIHVGRRAVLANRRIRKGEILSFFYPSTEWSMSRPFPCHCGAPGGLVEVRGARDLPLEILRRFPLSAHIRRMKERQGQARTAPKKRRPRTRLRRTAA
jgi:SET domain-containing protein